LFGAFVFSNEKDDPNGRSVPESPLNLRIKISGTFGLVASSGFDVRWISLLYGDKVQLQRKVAQIVRTLDANRAQRDVFMPYAQGCRLLTAAKRPFVTVMWVSSGIFDR
jgi:hypothetical protein